MPHQDPDIVGETLDKLFELIHPAVAGKLPLVPDFLACDFDFELMFFFGLGRRLHYSSAPSITARTIFHKVR